ncbi:MAG: hypothetical protein KJZ54_00155 [Phycisphaerales bacterium]|nr:hypothetical protein [Phycisphaerales bacterium]
MRSRPSRNTAFFATLTAILIVPPGARGQSADDTLERLESWLSRAWEEAQTLPSIPDASLRWRVEDRYVPTQAELDALRNEVAGRPDHPKRPQLNIYERRLRDGPDVVHYELWLDGETRWRLNTNFPPGFLDGGYIDTAWAPGSAWKLAPRGLTIAESSPETESAQTLLSSRSTFTSHVSRLLDGGMGVARTMRLTERAEPVLDGTRWSVVASSEPIASGVRRRVRFSGVWDRDADRGFVRAAEVIESPSNSQARWDIDSWIYDDTLGRHVATTIRYRADGVDQRIVFEGAGVIPKGGFDALTRTPRPGETDPIRGRVDPPAVRDHTRGTTLLRDEEGRLRQVEVAGESPSTKAEGGLWRGIGVAALVATLLVMGVLWLARRRIMS